MKKILIAFCFSVLCSAALFAESPIYTTVPSLTITPNARAGGMGDQGVATSPDANSQYWNPAKYAFLDKKFEISLSYTPWLRQLVSDIDLAYLAGYYKLNDNQAISASVRYFSLGDIKLTDESGSFLSTAHPNEYAIDVAYSRVFTDKFSGAVALRYIRSDLGNGTQNNEMTPGSTVAADVAAYYKTPVRLEATDGILSFGLNISNIGGKISYDDNATNNFIPTNLRLGSAFEYPLDPYNKITVSAELNKLLVPSKNDSLNDTYYYNMSPITGIFKSFSDAPGGMSEEMREITWSLGAEYAYNNQFFVRGGYFNESKTKGNRKYFTVGAGFKLNVVQIDAGYVMSVAQTNPLDKTLRLSLTFDPFGLKDLLK